MVKRRRFKQLPLQAHFFPMASSVIMEDEMVRMTLLSAQPSGVANLASGMSLIISPVCFVGSFNEEKRINLVTVANT